MVRARTEQVRIRRSSWRAAGATSRSWSSRSTPTYFATPGFAALIFDYRGFGGSGGEPRQHLDPWAQIEDYRNAISYVETRPEVDADRIAVWGISYSGGHALIVGAVDRRVRAVLSIVPVVEGLETMRRAHGTMGFRRFTSELLGEPPAPLPLRASTST